MKFYGSVCKLQSNRGMPWVHIADWVQHAGLQELYELAYTLLLAARDAEKY